MASVQELHMNSSHVAKQSRRCWPNTAERNAMRMMAKVALFLHGSLNHASTAQQCRSSQRLGKLRTYATPPRAVPVTAGTEKYTRNLTTHDTIAADDNLTYSLDSKANSASNSSNNNPSTGAVAMPIITTEQTTTLDESMIEQRWTIYLEALHRVNSVPELLQLIEEFWPDQQQAEDVTRSSSSSSSTRDNKATRSGKQDVSQAITSSAQSKHWKYSSLIERTKAAAAVDTLERLGAMLSRHVGHQQQYNSNGQGTKQSPQHGSADEALLLLVSTPSSDDEDNSSKLMVQQTHGSGTLTNSGTSTSSTETASTTEVQSNSSQTKQSVQPLTTELVTKCQESVQRVLKALPPLMSVCALRPKQLASLARAINTLAALSPPTNSRATQNPKTINKLSSATQSTANPDNGNSTDRSGTRINGRIYVLEKLPAGFADGYSQAVIAALPSCSTAGYCYLLRALSLDRCKRLLRAAKKLATPLQARVVELAPSLNITQTAIVISCGAQMVWDPAGPWLQALMSQAITCSADNQGKIPATEAAAIFHALGQLQAQPPPYLTTLLFTSLAAALPVQGSRPAGQTSAAGGRHSMQSNTGSVVNPEEHVSLNPLQLSSVLWAAARLSLPPPELWFMAFMETSYYQLKAHAFTPSQLANMMWALATLDWAPSPLWLAALFASLQQALPRMTAGELAMMVWALGHIKFRPTPELCHSLLDAAAGQAALLDARQLSMLFVTCARVNFKPSGGTTRILITRLLALLQQRYGSPGSGSSVLDNNGSSSQATDASSNAGEAQQNSSKQQKDGKRGGNVNEDIGSRHRDTVSRGSLTASRPAAGAQAPEIAPQALANTLWALQHLGLYHIDKRVVPVLCHASLAAISNFNMVELGMVGQSLGIMLHYKPPPGKDAKDQKKGKKGQYSKQQPSQSSMSSSDTADDNNTRISSANAGPAGSSPSDQARLQVGARDYSPVSRFDTTALMAGFLKASKEQLRMMNNKMTGKHASGKGQAAGGQQGQHQTTRRRVPSIPSQCAGLLLGAVKLGGNVQPPKDWMAIFYKVTQRSLLLWRVKEMETLMEAIRLMQPPPAPPLSWVHTLSDRRDQLCGMKDTPKHLKDQMLLGLRIIRHALQVQQQQEQQQEQTPPPPPQPPQPPPHVEEGGASATSPPGFPQQAQSDLAEQSQMQSSQQTRVKRRQQRDV